MNERPKTNSQLWRTKDILLVIPQIADILDNKSKNKKFWNRSLSQRSYIKDDLNPEADKNTPKLSLKTSSMQKNQSFDSNYMKIDENYQSLQGSTVKISKILPNSKFSSKSNKKPTKRKQIFIPVINLEKSLPLNYKVKTLLTKRSQLPVVSIQKKKSIGSMIEIPLPKQLSKKDYKALKSKTKDESIGIEVLQSQSSGLITETGLLSRF